MEIREGSRQLYEVTLRVEVAQSRVAVFAEGPGWDGVGIGPEAAAGEFGFEFGGREGGFFGAGIGPGLTRTPLS